MKTTKETFAAMLEIIAPNGTITEADVARAVEMIERIQADAGGRKKTG